SVSAFIWIPMIGIVKGYFFPFLHYGVFTSTNITFANWPTIFGCLVCWLRNSITAIADVIGIWLVFTVAIAEERVSFTHLPSQLFHLDNQDYYTGPTGSCARSNQPRTQSSRLHSQGILSLK